MSSLYKSKEGYLPYRVSWVKQIKRIANIYVIDVFAIHLAEDISITLNFLCEIAIPIINSGKVEKPQVPLDKRARQVKGCNKSNLTHAKNFSPAFVLRQLPIRLTLLNHLGEPLHHVGVCVTKEA